MSSFTKILKKTSEHDEEDSESSKRDSKRSSGRLSSRSTKKKSMKNIFKRWKSRREKQPHQFDISEPFNFTVETHAEVDPDSPLGIKGLPKEWEELLAASKISKEEVLENTENVMSVLKFHFEGPAEPLPTKQVLKQQMLDNWSIDTQDPNKIYRKEKKLGEGAGGVVYKVTDLRTGEIKAVKICPMEELTYLKQEIAMHAMSSHANVVKYGETIAYQDSIWISMEYIDGGNLYDLISPSLPKFPEPLIGYVLQQALIALSYMHRKHLLHRDIKSDNILFGLNGCIKIADFGFATGLCREENKRKSVVGTPYWMAPEVIRQEEYDNRVDIWSIGIVGIEIVDGDPPHYDQEQMRALLLIASSKVGPTLKNPKKSSDEYNKFLDKCLQVDSTKRSSAEELLTDDAFIQKAGTRAEFSVFATTCMDIKRSKSKKKGKAAEDP